VKRVDIFARSRSHGIVCLHEGARAFQSLPQERYTGIMTQPAMLAALAHSSDTSYVFRGRFVRKRLLCQEIGTPPANAMAEFANLMKPANPTAREVATVVEAQPACGGCHNLIDPGGLAFEHFDAMGAYRDQYATGKAIDTKGSLAAVTVTGSRGGRAVPGGTLSAGCEFLRPYRISTDV